MDLYMQQSAKDLGDFLGPRWDAQTIEEDADRKTSALLRGISGGKAMGAMNRKMNLPQISKIMQEFEKQNEMMGMKEEMMSDAMDDAFAADRKSVV